MNEIFKNIKVFSDIYKLSKKLTTKEKGDFFELITMYIFKIHPNYYNKTKNIWMYDDIPFKIRDNFKLPNKDKGIDLLLETNDDEFFAIQCKFRSKVFGSINWTELSTFAGQLFVGNFKSAIFVTNTYDINEEINKCDKISCLFGDFFKDDNLDEQFFDNVRNFINNKKIIYKKRDPYPHQILSIEKSLEHFENGNKGYLSMACGTGKTYTTCEIDRKMQNELTIILVPSLYLLSQIYKEWSLEYANDKNIKFVLVGSDAESREPFLSTDEKEIKEKIEKYWLYKIIIISTYQSCEKLRGITDNVDLIIFDEAHKTVGESIFSFAIFDKNIKAKKRLFVTATPKIYNKISDEDNDDDIISMDNESLYGKCINEYQIGQAIDDKMLTPYEIHLMYITDDQIKKFKNKIVNVEGVNINFHYIATCMMIKEMIDKKDINHLLTYHASIQNSKDFSKILEGCIEDINVDHIDGAMSSKKKASLINEFKNAEKGILTSARVLNEGVNIVEVDSVCFVESRNSGIDIIQCIGRALRLLKGKTFAKILIPINEEDVEESKFKELIKIVKNLGEYDYQVKECMVGNKKINRKLIKVNCYNAKDNINKIHDEIVLDELNGKIQSCIMGGVYSWENTYNELVKYFEDNKKCPSTIAKDISEKRLGVWIAVQKRNYKKNKEAMCNIIKRKLWEELNKKYKEYIFDPDEIWNNNYDRLIIFFEDKKKRPNNNSKDTTEKKLGNWISDQKKKLCKK
jgi:predicted helicase